MKFHLVEERTDHNLIKLLPLGFAMKEKTC